MALSEIFIIILRWWLGIAADVGETHQLLHDASVKWIQETKVSPNPCSVMRVDIGITMLQTKLTSIEGSEMNGQRSTYMQPGTH